MQISYSLLNTVDECKYLTTENAWRYRGILRFFYTQYEKMRYSLYIEDVYQGLSGHEEYKEYTLDMIKQDLDQLVVWHNVIPLQDTAKVTSTEEFKNRKFRYYISEKTVEIERLMIRLENFQTEKATLETMLLERLANQLSEMHIIAKEEGKKVGGWWYNLMSDFKNLNQNYQDYIRDFYSPKAEEVMKSSNFLTFKDQFIEYLRNFIKELQQHAYAIQNYLLKIDEQTVQTVFEKVLEYELSIPHLDEAPNPVIIEEQMCGKWETLQRWFVEKNGECEVTKILEMTNEIIRKITRYAAQILENRHSSINRKEEYKKVISLFQKCSTLEEAHRLSAHCFGMSHVQHISLLDERQTESIYSSMFEESPTVFTIRPKVTTYREKAQRNAIVDRSIKKEELRQKILAQREAEKELLGEYIQNGKITFAKLPVISPRVRSILLRWLSRGLQIESPQTEYGIQYKVIRPPKNAPLCQVICEDGEFYMPNYELQMEV